jgi:peptide deformylase
MRLALNPVVEWRSDELYEVWDDCMCLPEIAVRVRRHCSLTLSGFDEAMRPFRMERLPADLAELFQHELDHLDGIVMTDRMLPEWGVVARAVRDIARPLG